MLQTKQSDDFCAVSQQVVVYLENICYSNIKAFALLIEALNTLPNQQTNRHKLLIKPPKIEKNRDLITAMNAQNIFPKCKFVISSNTQVCELNT